MFSSRFLIVKIVLGLAVFLLLCGHSETTHRARNPEFWVCQTVPERYHGSPIFLAVVPVTQRLPDRFEIISREYRIWITDPPAALQTGDFVTLTGRFDRGNFIRLEGVRVHKGYPWKRSVMFVISAAVLGILAIQFLRAFRPPTSRGLFFSTDNR